MLTPMARCVSHLLFGFDSTLTTEDTLHLIASAGYTHHSRRTSSGISTGTGTGTLPDAPVLAADGYPSWADFGRAYMEDFDVHTSQFGPRTTLEEELAYLASLKPVEQASVKRVERSALFRGVTDSEIRYQARFARMRNPDALRTLVGKAMDRGTKVGVVSVTWSAVFVRAALGVVLDADVVRQIEVYANDVVMGPDGAGTGGLTKDQGEGLATGADKLRVLRRITGRKAGHPTVEPEGEGEGLVVYVGDSTTDLPPLLEADVGVVVDDNKNLAETCERLGIPVEQGLTASRKVEGRKLYKIEDWSELLPLIEG